MTTKIELNGETYIKESEALKKAGEFKPSPVQIVVLNRGWIAVGNVSESAGKTIIQNASIIRNWGTENGLGELAEKGKLPETILDACPDISVDSANIVFVMNCNQTNWA